MLGWGLGLMVGDTDRGCKIHHFICKFLVFVIFRCKIPRCCVFFLYTIFRFHFKIYNFRTAPSPARGLSGSESVRVNLALRRFSDDGNCTAECGIICSSDEEVRAAASILSSVAAVPSWRTVGLVGPNCFISVSAFRRNAFICACWNFSN